MKFNVDLSDFKDSSIRRMLRDALHQHAERELPIHKRESKDGEPDEATKEQDDENDKLVAMHNSRGEPAPIPVTDEDMPEEVSDRMMKAKPDAKFKKGKKA
jgi:hypothetical protein